MQQRVKESTDNEFRMTGIKEYTKNVNAKIEGGWLITRWKEYSAWQMENRVCFDVFIEAMGLQAMFEEVVADIRSTEIEAWELAHEKLQNQMIGSITRFVDEKRFMEAKIHSLKDSAPINQNKELKL